MDRDTGFHGDDARYLPAADCGSHEPALTVAQEGDIVDEVDHSNVRAVVSTGSDVIYPTGIGVGYSAEVTTAASGSGRVDGTRERVERAKVEVAAKLRVQVYLQPIVMRV